MDTLKSLPDDENKEVIVWLVQNALAVPNDFKYFVWNLKTLLCNITGLWYFVCHELKIKCCIRWYCYYFWLLFYCYILQRSFQVSGLLVWDFTGWMPFLSPNQQCQSTEGMFYTLNGLLYLKGSVKEPNILIYFFFSAHHSVVFCFRCSVYWWKGSVRF